MFFRSKCFLNRSRQRMNYEHTVRSTEAVNTEKPMKRLLLTTALIILIDVTIACAQTKPSHPYLFFIPERIQQIKERIKADTMMARVWNDMQRKADISIKEERGGNLELLSLAWRMTAEKKYAEAAKKNLLQLLSRKQWDGMDDRTPRWNSGLNTAHSCLSAALAYDCIYDQLSKAERKEIAEGIVALGIKPLLEDWISDDQRIHSLNSMGHNWWSACVYMAGVASMAVKNEIPEADAWTKTVMDASKEWFIFAGSVLENKPSNFDAAGGFYESISYADFGMSEYLLFRLAYTNVFGAVKMPYDQVLEKTADWFIQSCYPNRGRMMSLNFGDSNPHANGSTPVKLMLALGYHKERYYWYLNEIRRGQPRGSIDANNVMGFVYEPEYQKTGVVPDLPPSSIYRDMGWATLRSSWERNATLLGVKCGYTWNHAHADAGSFVLYHKGKNLLIDGGDVGYGLPEYSSYFVRSEAHNVMLFNGSAQDPQDQYHAVKNPGHLYHLMDGGNLKYVLADATGPTSRNFLRNYRSFLWIGNVILVIDDVKTFEPGKFEWLLHFEKEAKKKGPDLEISHDSASVLVRPLFPETLPTGYPHDFPEKMKLEERTGIKDRDAKTKITYFALSPAEASRQTKFITAIILLDDKNKTVETFTGSSGASGAAGRTNLPILEKLEGKDMIGVKITQNGEVTYVYFNLLADGRLMHRNSINIVNGWETDAYMMAVTFPENSDTANADLAKNYFIANGSFLRRDGKVVFHALSKVFLNAKKEGSRVEVILQGQPVIQANLRMTEKPKQVLMNGNTAAPLYQDNKKMLTLNIN
jgi:oligo-alginate lyase